MNKTLKDFGLIIVITLFLTFLIWLPHYLGITNFFGLDFSNGFATIYRNFDGVEYITIAKTFYDPRAIVALPYSLSPNYYAAHFPFFPLLLIPLASFLGFLKSMLLVSLAFTILSTLAFYLLVKDFKLSDHPLLLSFIFLLLPARWFVVHSVGSAEPIFIFFTILAIYFFMKFEKSKKYPFIFLAGIAGFFAQFTRPPGIILFIALFCYSIWKIWKSDSPIIHKIYDKIIYIAPLLFIPAGLLAVFYWFQISYGDFWAYFHSGDNIHLTFPPFQVFNLNQFWVGSIWLEDIIYVFILGFLGGLLLLKQKLYPMAFFVLTYLAASIFVAHRDISRYVLPVFPFVLIAFEKTLTSKEFKIVIAIVVLAIYLYAQNFLIANTAPIANLEVFN